MGWVGSDTEGVQHLWWQYQQGRHSSDNLSRSGRGSSSKSVNRQGSRTIESGGSSNSIESIIRDAPAAAATLAAAVARVDPLSAATLQPSQQQCGCT
jgi:hypothetical protein